MMVRLCKYKFKLFWSYKELEYDFESLSFVSKQRFGMNRIKIDYLEQAQLRKLQPYTLPH